MDGTRKKVDARPLDTGESFSTTRLADITQAAGQAFGDLEKGLRWLHKPNRALAGEKPVNLLNSEAGIALVKQALGTIEYGGVS